MLWEITQLIPAEDLGLDGDLLVVGRETSLQSGAVDLLCLARSRRGRMNEVELPAAAR